MPAMPGFSAVQSRYARAMESLSDVIANYVDPDDAFLDAATGERWLEIGIGDNKKKVPFDSEEGLTDVRNKCRDLALRNEFAINGHENRINYLIGSGHAYTAVAKEGAEPGDDAIRRVQDILDEFVKVNRWGARQQEIVRRRDRDGEVFLRLFPSDDGIPRVRFIEPDQVYRPRSMAKETNATFGIVTEPNDVETVVSYLVDGQVVDASEVQHRKLGVDNNVKRGIPLFYPVHKNLGRAERLLRNMTAVAEIQAAIAFIRKHAAGTSATIANMVTGNADQTVTNNNLNNATSYHRHYAPGTILDASQGTDFEFPSSGVNPAVYVAVLQAELRAIASRLVMPEFMLTSDASNANYASTMVSEGPAVKQFSRLQWGLVEDDLEIMESVLDGAVVSGRLDQSTRDAVEIDVEPPRLEVRNRKEEIEGDATLVREKVMSRHTCAIRHDLDPDREKKLIENERKQMDPYGEIKHNPLFDPKQNKPDDPNSQDDET